MRLFGAFLCGIAVIALSFAALSDSLSKNENVTESSPDDIIVFAAASMHDVMLEIGEAFENETGVHATISAASSSALAQQIEQGAEADIYVSANRRWVAYLEDQGLASQSRAIARNRLVLIVPRDTELTCNSPEDLQEEAFRSIAIGQPDSVPAGVYAKQALMHLQLWETLARKMVAANNVRTALAFVENGAAEAGVVYATDALASQKVRVAAVFPESATPPIDYFAAQPATARNRKGAEQFLAFLNTPIARTIFERHGFIPHKEEAGNAL